MMMRREDDEILVERYFLDPQYVNVKPSLMATSKARYQRMRDERFDGWLEVQ